MKLKKFFALALAAATLALALTACGSKADDSADNSDANTDNQSGETVTVKLGVVGGIYDDLWASAKAALADEGIDLEIVQFSDYVTPNNALANGDIDLNAFQHRIYLQNEIDNYGYAIQNIGNTFIINIKDTSVLSVISITDLFFVHKSVVGALYTYFESAAIVMVIYLTMTLFASYLLRLWEKALDGPQNYDLNTTDSLAYTSGMYNAPDPNHESQNLDMKGGAAHV